MSLAHFCQNATILNHNRIHRPECVVYPEPWRAEPAGDGAAGNVYGIVGMLIALVATAAAMNVGGLPVR